jgi:hypothetical protein
VSGVATLPAANTKAGPQAFSFAAKINNAARAAELAEADRPQAIEAARRQLLVAQDRSDLMATEAGHTDASAALALHQQNAGSITALSGKAT